MSDMPENIRIKRDRAWASLPADLKAEKEKGMAEMDLSWDSPYNITKNDEELFKEIKKAVEKYKIKKVYETGTHIGGTAHRLSTMVDEVYTVEYMEKFYKISKENLSKIKNIKQFEDDSANFFKNNLVQNDENVLFFLDAHGFGGTNPLRQELIIIAEKKVKPPIIFIHDFKTSSKANAYNGGISMDDLSPFFKYVYGNNNFAYYYIENEGTVYRGTAVIMPKE